MTDALLAAVLANPADDNARLYYADFLDDRGEPGDAERAAFIRVQVELPPIDGKCETRQALDGQRFVIPCDRCESCKTWARLWRRQRDLVQRYGHEWALPGERVIVAGGDGRPSIRCSLRDGPTVGFDFDRGFVSEVGCPSAFWLSDGDELCSRHPLSRVRLATMPPAEWLFSGAPAAYSRTPAENVGRTERDRCLTNLAARWPRIAFELPAETWGNGMPSDSTSTTVSYEWPARSPRRNRPDFSAATWQPRFPRPR